MASHFLILDPLSWGWHPASMSDLLVLSSDDIHALFDVPTAVESQRRAFTELGRGTALLAPKVGVDGAADSLALGYLARISPSAAAVAKLVSVNPSNAARGLPAIHGLIVVLDADTGQPAAIMDGTSITTLRTAAGSAVAVDALAPATASRLVIIGTGVQAEPHVRAISHVRGLEQVTVLGRDDSREPVREADIVVLATSSRDPVVEHESLAPGATVVSIGSFEPDRSEVAARTVTDADLVVVDDVSTSLERAGSIRGPIADGLLDADALVPLGEILTGLRPGRTSDDQLVFYNSVGVGVQDAAAAEAVLLRAEDGVRGQHVPLG